MNRIYFYFQRGIAEFLKHSGWCACPYESSSYTSKEVQHDLTLDDFKWF
tara:strand:- start:184 stop:330 length:147 start_codon:yes stop_codon:yes gene_type:complete